MRCGGREWGIECLSCFSLCPQGEWCTTEMVCHCVRITDPNYKRGESGISHEYKNKHVSYSQNSQDLLRQCYACFAILFQLWQTFLTDIKCNKYFASAKCAMLQRNNVIAQTWDHYTNLQNLQIKLWASLFINLAIM